jgi:hypothetical protein
MNLDRQLTEIRDLIQQDISNRGLGRHPQANLLTACPNDFALACHHLAEAPDPVVAIVTGFTIPSAEPPWAETDGPPGALFLARALVPLGMRLFLAIDPPYVSVLDKGLRAVGLSREVPIWPLPGDREASAWQSAPCLPTHLIALERAGPGHTEDSIRKQYPDDPETVERFLRMVSREDRGHCRSMGGRDITEWTQPAHVLFEERTGPVPLTIGIGDGGNEIGMGKIPWQVIHSNIVNGGRIACRVATDHLLVAGVSNWGAYALAVGVALVRGLPLDLALFDLDRERQLLRLLVEQGPLVDGFTGKPTVQVDGLPFEEYARPLDILGKLAR